MYLKGFGNHHETEAVPGALPKNQNSPQQCSLGLYAEQLSGSAFTRPRHSNFHSWLYRTLPSVVHEDYRPYTHPINQALDAIHSPNPMRWSPFSDTDIKQDFIDGLFHVAGNSFLNAYIYQCNQSMTTRYFSDSDGELLFVPYQGKLCLKTEFGKMDLAPGMIAVIPRGVTFKVEILESKAAGYLCENSGLPLTLPELGLMGANGLANPRHFLYPVADVEESQGKVSLICKYQQQLWSALSDHTPLNVVAWHGNYAPYCYDLSLFNTINSVSFDHPDPSIFTVLSAESGLQGVANLDFVIFPSRWVVAEHTFRPPYFHRNLMSEFMGLVTGTYDAKDNGFRVGGFSIHNTMSAHGPDLKSYQEATASELKPQYYDNTLAFMFETREPWKISEAAFKHPMRQQDYTNCWKGFTAKFKSK